MHLNKSVFTQACVCGSAHKNTALDTTDLRLPNDEVGSHKMDPVTHNL